ncbi:flippase-like domain-containing protein [Halorubellus sp. JP-L1]|uniref:lysylphosphatidylglycerol synthase transmembrane domain-containing protein n=1 Tax=Halorubellus sp. JP-L1 TaxID=2715753 RepID=UPI001407C2CB|nr:lysylphosphatidylglycerol synthase transmembrane domain-containing protein [Halorubellus sp. JP-L1]NHN42049.1 flippase-like domain-containing protein [Halorubellus sp. JP-L1]
MFEDVDARAIVAGFVGAALVLAGLLWFVGVDDVLERLAQAPPGVLALIVLAALCWLTSWGLALRSVLSSLGLSMSVVQSFVVFTAAMFANNVTPFGQAGGEPVSALFISREADTEYETALAAIASVDGLNFVPSIGFALLAVGYYAVTIAFNDRLVFVAAAVAALAVALAVGAVLGWRHRYAIEHRIVRGLAPVLGRVSARIPVVSRVSVDAIEARIEGFFHAIERVATDRRNLATALSLSALGWAFTIASLSLSLYAVSDVPAWNVVAASMLAIPLGSLAGVTPLPGGLGGIEAVLIFVLTPVTALGSGTVAAAVLLHRAATYWLPLLLGGGSVAAISARN